MHLKYFILWQFYTHIQWIPLILTSFPYLTHLFLLSKLNLLPQSLLSLSCPFLLLIIIFSYSYFHKHGCAGICWSLDNLPTLLKKNEFQQLLTATSSSAGSGVTMNDLVLSKFYVRNYSFSEFMGERVMSCPEDSVSQLSFMSSGSKFFVRYSGAL